MSEKRYTVRPNKVGSWCVVDVPADCVELILDSKVNAQLAVNLLNQQAAELDTLRTQNRELRAARGDNQWLQKLNRVYTDISSEIGRQDAKWGSDRILDDRTWITILIEEVGEVGKASLERKPDEYRAELVQVAAVCIQAIISQEREQALSRAAGEVSGE